MTRRMIARLSTTAALAALALSPLSAAAQDAAAPEFSPFGAEVQAPMIFEAIDADGNGAISVEELAAALEALSPQMRGAMVRSLVDPEARRAAMAEAMVARLDTDGDGRLSAEELAAGMAARAEARAARRAEMQAAGAGHRAGGMAPRGREGWRESRRAERMDGMEERREGWRGRHMQHGEAHHGRPFRGEGRGSVPPTAD